MKIVMPWPQTDETYSMQIYDFQAKSLLYSGGLIYVVYYNFYFGYVRVYKNDF